MTAEQDKTEFDRHREAGEAVTDRASYERPKDVRDPEGERADGRPTGETDEDGLQAGLGSASAPTEAVEEEGAHPTTEHAPGGDL